MFCSSLVIHSVTGTGFSISRSWLLTIPIISRFLMHNFSPSTLVSSLRCKFPEKPAVRFHSCRNWSHSLEVNSNGVTFTNGFPYINPSKPQKNSLIVSVSWQAMSSFWSFSFVGTCSAARAAWFVRNKRKRLCILSGVKIDDCKISFHLETSFL